MIDPNLILLGSIAAAVLIVLLDLDSGVSIDPPGPRRFGAAAIIAASGSVTYFLMRHGVQALLDKLASNIIGFVIIGGLVLAYLFKWS